MQANNQHKHSAFKSKNVFNKNEHLFTHQFNIFS